MNPEASQRHAMRYAARHMRRSDGWEYVAGFTMSALAGFTLALALDRRFNRAPAPRGASP